MPVTRRPPDRVKSSRCAQFRDLFLAAAAAASGSDLAQQNFGLPRRPRRLLNLRGTPQSDARPLSTAAAGNFTPKYVSFRRQAQKPGVSEEKKNSARRNAREVKKEDIWNGVPHCFIRLATTANGDELSLMIINW